jgi:hypothetical protein
VLAFQELRIVKATLLFCVFLKEIDSPANLVTDRVTENSVTVSWDSVEADIDMYVVSYSSVDGVTRDVPVGKDKSSTVLTGLKPGVEYKVYVWAKKGDRESKKANTKAPTGNERDGQLELNSELVSLCIHDLKGCSLK